MPGDARTPRSLGLRHVYAIGTGAMFSSGFFLLPGLAAGETGPSVPVAYLLAGLLVVPAVLSTAELATAFPKAGGPYHFLHRSLGPTVATVGALGLFVAMVLKAAFALVGIGAYLSMVAEVPVVPLAVALAVVLTGLNIAGTRESARLQLGLVAVLVVVLLAFVVTGAIEVGRRGGAAAADAFSPFLLDGGLGLLAAAGLLFVSYAGLLQVASIAGEVREPQRTIPRGLLLSLATATGIYVGGSAVMVGVLEPDALRDESAPVAAAVAEIPLPLGTGLVVAAALAAFTSTGNAGIMSASRYPLALARDGLLWSRFARLGRFGTPTAAVLLTGGATAAAIAAFDVEGIARLASAFILVVFALVNLSVIVLRSGRAPGYLPTFRAPLQPWLPLVGIVASVGLVIDLGLGPALFTAGVVVAGASWHAVARRGRRDLQDEGVARHLLHRLRQGRLDEEDLQRLQEVGPRPDDHAPELLGEAATEVLPAGAPAGRVLAASAAGVAGRLGVLQSDVQQWIDSRRHLSVEPAPGQAVHLVLLDTASQTTVSVAWAPPAEGGDDGHEDEPDGGSSATQGALAVIVAGSEGERARLTRLAALLTSQVGSGEVLAQIPGQHPSGTALRRSFVEDATRRQGGDPVG
jgi:basic amino acid/polyamine antiporter, APA family